MHNPAAVMLKQSGFAGRGGDGASGHFFASLDIPG